MTAHSARTHHLITGNLMKRFIIITEHIVNIMIPIILEAVTELQVRITLQHLYTYHKRFVSMIKKKQPKTKVGELSIRTWFKHI
jgi:hypothetical protein